MGRKKTSPTSKAVKIHEDVYRDSMIVAGYEELDLTQFLSEILRPIVREKLIKHAEKTVNQAKEKRPPKG